MESTVKPTTPTSLENVNSVPTMDLFESILGTIKQEADADGNAVNIKTEHHDESDSMDANEEYWEWEYDDSIQHTATGPFKIEIPTLSSSESTAEPTRSNKTYMCEICQRAFGRNYHLKRHMTTHTGEKAFECTICHKTFPVNHSLERHYLTHTGEKPFKCENCDKTFSRKDKLSRHVKTVHEGERRYICKVCDKSFGRSEGLRHHENTTHPNAAEFAHQIIQEHQCNLCEYKTSLKSSLTKHLVTHSNDKPFKCDLCSYRTSRQSSLKRHIESKQHNKVRNVKAKDLESTIT